MMIDSRDIPRLCYRPCFHCGHRHYFLTDQDDAANCAMCNGELYPIATIVAGQTPPIELLQYVRHHPKCTKAVSARDVFDRPVVSMQGCDCGLDLLIKGLPKWAKTLLGSGSVGWDSDRQVNPNETNTPRQCGRNGRCYLGEGHKEESCQLRDLTGDSW